MLQIRLSKTLGLRHYASYRLNTNHVVPLRINEKEIWVRKGTPDLLVAVSCLSGEFHMLNYLFPKDYSGIIVDAGGYIGTAAIAFSEMYPKATVLTIEPSTTNFSILEKNIAPYPNIKAIHGALTASDEKKIHLNERPTGEWGFTVVKNAMDSVETSKVEEVPAYRLSSLGVAMNDIGILKLDIEGGEHAILTNDQMDLSIIPAILIELHDRIVDGCSEAFFSFSENRIVLKDKGEKFLSIKKDISSRV